MDRRCCIGLAMLLLFGCEPAGQLPRPESFTPIAGDIESQAVQIVLDGLAHPDPQVRANAIEVVATTKQLSLMPKVHRLLGDETVRVRSAAAMAVGDLAYGPAENDIAELLKDPEPYVQIAAAYAATKLGHSEYYSVFRNAVTSEDQTVRANAALLLGKSGQKEGIRFLYWTMQRPDSANKVVLNSLHSIAMLRDERIYPKLWSRLISAYADDRILGIQAMGALGTEQAKNAIITMLEDTVVEVRLAAAAQLGTLGEPIGEARVAEAFEKNLLAGRDAASQQQAKFLAAVAIGEIGSDRLTKHLPELLRDPSMTVRLAAAKAVVRSQRSNLGR